MARDNGTDRPHGAPSKDGARAYSVKNVNEPWQAPPAHDTARFFCVSPRARVDRIGKSLSRRLINVRVMRGFPERAWIRCADKAVFLAVRAP